MAILFPIFIQSFQQGLVFHVSKETSEVGGRLKGNAREICRSLFFDIAFLNIYVHINVLFFS